MEITYEENHPAVIIDDSDFDLVRKHNAKWYFYEGYAMCRSYVTREKIVMHRLIMSAQKGQQIDHINRNRLDNRKENLRFCNQSQNMANIIKKNNSSSKYKGVYYSKANSKWLVQIKCKGVSYYFGYHENEIQAALIADIHFKKLNGEFAVLNFP